MFDSFQRIPKWIAIFQVFWSTYLALGLWSIFAKIQQILYSIKEPNFGTVSIFLLVSYHDGLTYQ